MAAIPALTALGLAGLVVPSVPSTFLGLHAATAAHRASKSPISIFMVLSSSTSAGLSRLLTGQLLRSYSTGLCVRSSCGGRLLKRTERPRGGSRSQDDSRVEAADWWEDCRRKHGRNLTGEELRRLDDRESRGGEDSGSSLVPASTSLWACGAGSEREAVWVDSSRAAISADEALEATSSALMVSTLSSSGAGAVLLALSALTQEQSGDGMAGTVSDGLTLRGGARGGPETSQDQSEAPEAKGALGMTVVLMHSPPSSTISEMRPFLTRRGRRAAILFA